MSSHDEQGQPALVPGEAAEEAQSAVPQAQSPSAQEVEDFERLLTFLKENRAFDFTGYKRPSLIRRIRHRMRDVSVSTVDD